MESSDYGELKKLIKKHKINAMILSTDPLSHKAYINFSLENGISTLVDKPKASEKNIYRIC